MPPQKGKAPTKGAKQILMENESTVKFYRYMAGGAWLFYTIISVAWLVDTFTWTVIFMNVLVTMIYVGCLYVLKYMSRPRYTDTNQLLDPGLDLNMEGGMGEHVKDMVILTTISHLLSLISNYFWLLLLLMPIRAFWLLWKNVLAPWFFQAPPEDTEQDEKKRKKMERRMKRYQ